MKNVFQFIICVCLIHFSFIMGYGDTPQGLNKTTLQELKTTFKLSPTDKALMNAINNNDINKLALNREILNKYDKIFPVETDVKGITNQKSSGRCWIFAALNVMRPVTMQKFGIKSFEFSQSYLFFWDKLEKCNFFLELIIETRKRDINDRELRMILESPIGDGGWWNYAVSLIEKYGVVPKTVMPETENSSKSKMLNKVLQTLMRQSAVKIRQLHREGKKLDQLHEYKKEVLKDTYKLLVLHLGIPPEDFTWRYENSDSTIVESRYTPLNFYKKAVGVDLKEYIILFDHPVHDYNKLYRTKYSRNVADELDMTYINVGTKIMKEVALKSILDKEPVWFAADVGWQMERKHGLMAQDIFDYQSLYGIEYSMNKAERIAYGASSANHAMALVAADTSNGQPVKWKVENSWGKDLGDGGYWIMADSWFNEYVFNVIVHRKHIPENVLKLLDTKPIQLPAWDPLTTGF